MYSCMHTCIHTHTHNIIYMYTYVQPQVEIKHYSVVHFDCITTFEAL